MKWKKYCLVWNLILQVNYKMIWHTKGFSSISPCVLEWLNLKLLYVMEMCLSKYKDHFKTPTYCKTFLAFNVFKVWLTHSSSSYSLWCGMESWCFRVPPSPLVVACDPSTLLHTTVLSVTDVAGLWPGSPWTGLWFWSLRWWMWPWCWPACTGVCFWFLET